MDGGCYKGGSKMGLEKILNKKIPSLESQLNEIVNFSNVSAISNVYTLDLNKGDNFAFETLDTIAKTIVFANVTATANLILSVTTKLKYTNAAAISYPASVKWQNGTIPTFTAGKEYLLMFVSYDNGITWLGSSIGAW
jgi:hypothetical protein